MRLTFIKISKCLIFSHRTKLISTELANASVPFSYNVLNRGMKYLFCQIAVILTGKIHIATNGKPEDSAKLTKSSWKHIVPRHVAFVSVSKNLHQVECGSCHKYFFFAL